MTDSHRIEVLMLGWEYPPHISGGLGTACEGLTRALAPLDVRIDFVVPHLFGQEKAPHMRLSSPDISLPELDPLAWPQNYGGGSALSSQAVEGDRKLTDREFRERLAADQASHIEVVRIPAFLSPYLRPEQYSLLVKALETGDDAVLQQLLDQAASLFESGAAAGEGLSAPIAAEATPGKGPHYGNDLFGEVMRYAERVANWSRLRRPQVVHAHDWMTFPAATRVAHLHGIPMVAHVHSLEQDRSGGGANPAIVSIEGAGLRAATRVIAVSHYTARMINQLHDIPFDRIDVVHNGAYARKTVTAYREETADDRPMVLFLGRVTYQKGPDYFVEAAAKVLQQVPEARFVLAGNGDMLPRLKERVRELGMEKSFEFPGFVRGTDVERLFSTAEAYVMPSVSEPFGISALEAMSYDTPVVLSRQSGASEILHHALKVDFWDVNRLASQIVAILRYPELRNSIVEMAREEVRRVHWEAAATKVKRAYERALGGD
ncbi:MAG: glycosyl transferase group 1 [Myxococcaceae bacterium]|nr:glycosyl transferase group 1 [Myxococcaceae bacterium]